MKQKYEALGKPTFAQLEALIDGAQHLIELADNPVLREAQEQYLKDLKGIEDWLYAQEAVRQSEAKLTPVRPSIKLLKKLLQGAERAIIRAGTVQYEMVTEKGTHYKGIPEPSIKGMVSEELLRRMLLREKGARAEFTKIGRVAAKQAKRLQRIKELATEVSRNMEAGAELVVRNKSADLIPAKR